MWLLLHNNEFKLNLKCDFTCMLSVILFIANKYKECSLRVIIVFIVRTSLVTGGCCYTTMNFKFN